MMHLFKLFTGVYFVLALLLSLAPASPAIAQLGDGPGPDVADDIDGDGGEVFTFGDDCSRLEELSEETLMGLLQSKNRKLWEYFCRVEDPLECDEYSYLFEGLGALSATRKDPTLCRFSPSYEMREWVPDFYRNYGGIPEWPVTRERSPLKG